MNEEIYKALILVSAFAGFFCGTIVSRVYWINVYKIYRDEMSKQYNQILKNFGLEKNVNGVWEMHNENDIWIKK